MNCWEPFYIYFFPTTKHTNLWTESQRP